MTRVNVIVEGPTEESFIKNVLAPSLGERQIYVFPTLLGIPGHKGGRVNYARVKKDIILQLKQDRSAYCSTMFDLYGLGSGFPRLHEIYGSGQDMATVIERNMRDEILAAIPAFRPDIRFIPYLQVHEYEGLLFSDPEGFARSLGREPLAPELRRIRDSFASPEDINDDPVTAPSKRVLGLYPSYKKVIEGTLAAQAVGLTKMRQACPHFGRWVDVLESLIPLP